MAQENYLELAKHGNPRAIAALMNRSLQPKGIIAKTGIKDGCLQVMLESAQVPDQKVMIPFVRKGITSLKAKLIERVKVYGRQTGKDFPDWIQTFDLQINDVLEPFCTKQATLYKNEITSETLLKAFYTDAEVEQTIKSALNDFKVLVQLYRENEKISIVVTRQNTEYTNYFEITQIIKKELTKLRLKDIQSFEILGKVANTNNLEFNKLLQPTFDVVLESIYPLYKDKVIRELMTTTSLKEIEAASIINSLPTVIKAKVSKQESEKYKNAFEKIGAKIVLYQTFFYADKTLNSSIKNEVGEESENPLNFCFVSKGISLKVRQLETFLEVVIEANKEPVEKELILKIPKNIIRLGLQEKNIDNIINTDKKTRVKSPVWSQNLKILSKEKKKTFIILVMFLSMFGLPIFWLLGSIIGGLFSPNPESKMTTQLSSPAESAGSSCPCNKGCVYVTDSQWATMNGSDQDEFKRQVRAISGMCTIVVANQR